MSFKASINGFINGCRPSIGLDRTFLKVKSKGVLLSMVSLDGNNGIFPLDIYITRKENKDNWENFLLKMKKQLGGHPRKVTFTFTYDWKKGLNLNL